MLLLNFVINEYINVNCHNLVARKFGFSWRGRSKAKVCTRLVMVKIRIII